jgi:hypothetical protein
MNLSNKFFTEFHDSDAVAAIMHCGEELLVEFRGSGSETLGGVYKYQQVPLEVAIRFTTAESAGKYFRENVRGKFPSVRLW